MHIAVVNGPNLNLLGVREPALYGSATLADIEAAVRERARALGVEIGWLQSNHEGALVEAIQALRGRADGALINAAAYTHTSIAVRDAVLVAGVPFVEVHLTNIWAREEERRKSLLADLAVGVVAGFGAQSYVLALEGIVTWLRQGRSKPSGSVEV
ncbi:MAG TPA: type II 3-dehydroquinate dehydratase [Gemmatimonadales bacterium]|nr:type II 3-dehydroquinate dehydratase [Gemmatimonadales bacterium]